MHNQYIGMNHLKHQKHIIERITALWALNESGLGGFMHALNLSFSGILVGGISIISISLIAYLSKSVFKSVAKALTIVLLIKLAVSPHSPPTAYIAVGFQALMGILIFSVLSFKKAAFLLLGILTFLESALQKLLTLTIIYSVNFWEAIDIYGLWVADKLNITLNVSISEILIVFYITLYGLLGLLVGNYIHSLINRIRNIKSIEPYQIQVNQYQGNHKKKKSKKLKRLIFWLATILIVVFAFLQLSDNTKAWQKAFYILFRSLGVLFIWLFILSPLLMHLIKWYFSKKKNHYQEQIDNTVSLFPYLKSIVAISWKESKHRKGLYRLTEFVTNCILYSMFFKTE